MGSKKVVSDYLDDLLFADEAPHIQPQRQPLTINTQDTIAVGARLASAVNVLDYSALDNDHDSQQRFVALLELLHLAKALPAGRTHNYVLGHCQVLAAPIRKVWIRGRFDAYVNTMVLDEI